MKRRSAAPESIDAYIAAFPEDIQKRLKTLRKTIRAAAPGADERIGYGMPGFYLGGSLVYFGAFKNHIGFFPGSSGIAAFTRDLGAYEISKGTVRLPHDKPLPLELIARIVRFRAAENTKKAKAGSAQRV